MEQTQQKDTDAQECPDCHALAADLEAHKRWHSRLVHDIAGRRRDRCEATSSSPVTGGSGWCAITAHPIPGVRRLTAEVIDFGLINCMLSRGVLLQR